LVIKGTRKKGSHRRRQCQISVVNGVRTKCQKRNKEEIIKIVELIDP
jgi:hypothetical protein